MQLFFFEFRQNSLHLSLFLPRLPAHLFDEKKECGIIESEHIGYNQVGGNAYMKTDRLYAITVYLLNHGKVSASELAKKFEVSVRTVQRDMDALCQAGIPIAAEPGVSGGYYLTDMFRMEAQTATQEDYSFILTALKGFSSAMHNPKIDAISEKIASVCKDKNESILLDFSVLREGDEELLQMLQTAIRTKRPVQFTYTNAEEGSKSNTSKGILLSIFI